YEMATGQRPFPQSQSAELIGAILHQPPAAPSTHNRSMTSGLESVVMKSLDKEPARRYQSARELLVALEGSDATVAAVYDRRIVGARRTPLQLLGAVFLIVLLLAALVIGLNVGGLRDRVLHRDTAANALVHA